MNAMDACYITQEASGWWNLLIVVMAALLVFAVWAGWTWGRMAKADEIRQGPVR